MPNVQPPGCLNSKKGQTKGGGQKVCGLILIYFDWPWNSRLSTCLDLYNILVGQLPLDTCVYFVYLEGHSMAILWLKRNTGNVLETGHELRDLIGVYKGSNRGLQGA